MILEIEGQIETEIPKTEVIYYTSNNPYWNACADLEKLAYPHQVTERYNYVNPMKLSTVLGLKIKGMENWQ